MLEYYCDHFDIKQTKGLIVNYLVLYYDNKWLWKSCACDWQNQIINFFTIAHGNPSTIIYFADFQTYIDHIHSKVSYNMSQFQIILEHMNTYIVPTMCCVIVVSSSLKILATSKSAIFAWRSLSSKILDALMSLCIISGWTPSWRGH